MLKERGWQRGVLGGARPRFYLPLDEIFPQTNVSQFIC
jgi:hypothetical protein